MRFSTLSLDLRVKRTECKLLDSRPLSRIRLRTSSGQAWGHWLGVFCLAKRRQRTTASKIDSPGAIGSGRDIGLTKRRDTKRV